MDKGNLRGEEHRKYSATTRPNAFLAAKNLLLAKTLTDLRRVTEYHKKNVTRCRFWGCEPSLRLQLLVKVMNHEVHNISRGTVLSTSSQRHLSSTV